MPHEGIWCDGDRCVCVLRASGVMHLCAKGIWCDVGSCRRFLYCDAYI